MAHLAVNFHYVGMPKFSHGGIRGLSTEEFENSLSELSKSFEFISLAQLLEAVKKEEKFSNDICLISFDDGLRCQYEQALPILEKLQIPAAFFVLGCPYLDQKAATVHKLHWLRAHISDEKIYIEIEKYVESFKNVPSLNEVDDNLSRSSYRYDTQQTAKLKYYLNYCLPTELFTKLVDFLFKKNGFEEGDFIKNFYMNREMLKDLADREFIGSHTLHHVPLSKLKHKDLVRELEESKKFLDSLGSISVQVVSYPLGNSEAVSREVAVAAHKAGYQVGYTMERAVNKSLEDSLLLSRIDALDINTRSSLSGRSRYFQEK